MKKLLIPVLVIFLASAYVILQNGISAAVPSDEVSYANDVRPILESRCATCHMGDFVSEGLHMDTYESLMAGSQNGPVIVAGDASESLLVQKVTEGKMPKKGPKLTSAQIQTIIDWIEAGALNN